MRAGTVWPHDLTKCHCGVSRLRPLSGPACHSRKGQLMCGTPLCTTNFALPRTRFVGREGFEKYPGPEPSLAVAITRELRRHDASIDLAWVQQVILLYEEPAVMSARNAVLRMRPADMKSAFTRELARQTRPVPQVVSQMAPPARSLRSFSPDEYGG